MADKNAKLASALRLAKTATAELPMWFAFVAKGATEGTLLVAKNRVPPKEVADAKKKLGGGKIFKGRCRGEDGQLVFEVGQAPPGTLAKQIKTVIAEEAGMTMKVEVRVATDLATEDDEGPRGGDGQPELGAGIPPPPAAPPPVPPPPPLPVDEAARFTARLKALLPELQKVQTGASPLAQDVKLGMSEAQAFARKKDFEQANTALDKIEALVKQILGGTAPPPPPPLPVDEAARFTARLKALLPELQKVQTGASPLAQDVKLGMSEAQAFARKKDFEQANTALDKIEALVKQILGGTAPPPPPPVDGAATPTRPLEEAPALTGMAGWQAAVELVVKQLRQLKAAIVRTKDPDARRAEIILESVAKQLTRAPASPEQVASLERYLKGDDVITAAEEAPGEFGRVQIRAPLLKALQGLKQ